MKKNKKIGVIMLSALMLSGSAVNTGYAQESKTQMVALGGQSFGVRFYNDGVIVTELEEFSTGSGYVCPSKAGGLRVNDVIKTANGKKIDTNEDIQKAAQESGGNPIEFTVERDGQTLSKTVKPQQNAAGAYLLGAWVKDSCAGIGTVTYRDSSHHYFAALGHGICDNQTAALLPLGSAEVTGAKISSVTKSSAGKPGSLNGYFTDETLGSLSKNTPLGVFGRLSKEDDAGSAMLPLAQNDEIRVGKATVYTTLEQDTVGSYDAEITKICNKDKNSNENFVIKITDKTLLEKCGGIVQGMSGSPVVQNGKIVGAVTHVFMNDPKEGYGVLIQNMASKYLE